MRVVRARDAAIKLVRSQARAALHATASQLGRSTVDAGFPQRKPRAAAAVPKAAAATRKSAAADPGATCAAGAALKGLFLTFAV
jgi:hypothetical protein